MHDREGEASGMRKGEATDSGTVRPAAVPPLVAEAAPAPFRFGRFVLLPGRRSLTRAGTAVSLNARAFDLLCILVQHRHRVVSKDELRAEVWRGMAVDDNNLAVQISALRRTLGENPDSAPTIVTVPGRGYQFVAVVDGDAPSAPAPAATPISVSEKAIAPTAVIADMRSNASWPSRHRLGAAALASAGVVALTAWLLLAAPWAPHNAAPRLSIAVLPFRNLSGEAEQDYLADAISDDLTTDLSHIPRSTVIARASADTYRGRTATADAIGRALNVRYLLEGSIRAEGNALHINAQLIDAPTGGHLWARAFDVPRDKLGVARSDIVRSIAGALDVALTEVESARSLRDRPDNADAVDFYLRARSVIGRGNTLASLTQAQKLLEQAVASAPDFADALAALGNVLVRKVVEFDDPDDERDFTRAQAVIARALTLSPQSSAAITANGHLARADDRFEDARSSFQMALAVDPDDLSARQGMALCARQLGRMQEMIDLLQDLLRLDPASPANPRWAHLIGYGHLMLGDPRRARDWLERSGGGLSSDLPQESALGWQEWRQLYLIAVEWMTGEHDAAQKRYAAYSRQRLHRTVWRLAAYDNAAIAAQPGREAMLAALRAAGMPDHAREDENFGVAAVTTPQQGDDFSPTPLTLPGGTRIDTPALQAMLAPAPMAHPAMNRAPVTPPLILDVGRIALVPGSVLVSGQGSGSLLERTLHAAATARPGQPIVVAGDGTTGWSSYNAALVLVAAGHRSVLWYRGGNEAWAAENAAGVRLER